MRRQRGTTLADLVVSCGLFAVFMSVAVGLFTNMTRVVNREQKPAESLMEARVAVLKVCRRLRNCRGIVSPRFDRLLSGAPTKTLLLRDRVLRRTVLFQVQNGILTETYYPLDYDPEAREPDEAIKSLRLAPCSEFSIQSGGFANPTRFLVQLQMPDGRKVHGTTNLREAI